MSIVCGRSLREAQVVVRVAAVGARCRRRSSIAIARRLRISRHWARFASSTRRGHFKTKNRRFARAVDRGGLSLCRSGRCARFRGGVRARSTTLAKSHGVLAVTGASSTPALSHAVIDELTRGWTRVDSVEIAISPGNRAPLGLAVIKSILSYVGPARARVAVRAVDAGAGLGIARREGVSAIWARGCCRCARRPISIWCRKRFPSVRTAIFRAGLELSYSASRAFWR